MATTTETPVKIYEEVYASCHQPHYRYAVTVLPYGMDYRVSLWCWNAWGWEEREHYEHSDLPHAIQCANILTHNLEQDGHRLIRSVHNH